jgi:hypothetical protein
MQFKALSPAAARAINNESQSCNGLQLYALLFFQQAGAGNFHLAKSCFQPCLWNKTLQKEVCQKAP